MVIFTKMNIMELLEIFSKNRQLCYVITLSKRTLERIYSTTTGLFSLKLFRPQ
ncbi:hypothetical protein T4B_4631 [Trichinella pseudospiralis]|uniref:Uncharacterized protein n=1 Tax=Trichinella pseudospiralis TaxID=6337 RepID=A0A0V1E366_TRIPS|nr:hypothetical protein T4A_2536 [Trichinella pseudospiralis]KRY98846.1 hypothetical protein T4B_4631 [Trichinella pseudospiralis]KRZ08979.1 hypothetical protein T4C_11469 [Trichinella pseudospiralis]